MSGALGAAPSVRLAPESAKGAALPKLVQIVVKGGKTTAPETIGFYLGIKPGDPYDDEQVEAQLHEALGLGPLRGRVAREGRSRRRASS